MDRTEPPSRYVDATGVPPEVAAMPWDDAASRWRLDRLRAALPVDVPADAVLGAGQSNDVWLFGDHALRVCWRADRDRLLREAALLDALPAEVAHAPVVDAGEGEVGTWLLTARVPGRPLSEVVATASEPVARDLFGQHAQMLAALHAWTPPAGVRDVVARRSPLVGTDPMVTWAADLLPLPVPRLLLLLDLLEAVRFVRHDLVAAVRDRVQVLAPSDPLTGPSEEGPVTHGDAVLGNVLVHDGRISALLDFEWARIAPVDLELVSLVRATLPGPWSSAAVRRLPVLQWLAADYPALFAPSDLDGRLWLAEIAYMVRGVIWWPPDVPEDHLVAEHHLHALRRLVAAPWPR